MLIKDAIPRQFNLDAYEDARQARTARREQRRVDRREIEKQLKQRIDRSMAEPIHTGLDVIAEKTGSNTLQAIADFLRPTIIDQASMPGPLMVGEFSARAARAIPKLLDELITPKITPKTDSVLENIDELYEVLREEFPKISLSVPIERGTQGQKQLVLEFLQTLSDVPKGALDGARRASLRVSHGDTFGSFRPSTRVVEVGVPLIPSRAVDGRFGNYFAKKVQRDLQSALTHELTHSLVDKPELYHDVLEYLDAVGWGYRPVRGWGPPPASGVARNWKHAPTSYRALRQTDYTPWPLEGRPTTPVPSAWGHVPDPILLGTTPYGTVHPVEDIAEAGAYMLLGNMPIQYSRLHTPEIGALSTDVRYDFIRRLLQNAGVEIR